MKKFLGGLFSTIMLFCFSVNVNATESELIYGEDIPEGEEAVWFYVKDETTVDEYVDLTEEEAANIKVTLEASGYTKVTVKSYTVKTGTTTDKISKEFDSYEEAMNYIKSLEDEGYEVTNVNFVNNTDVEYSSLNKTFNSLSEAKKALAEFKEKYEASKEDVNENKTEDVIESIIGDTPYYKEEDAQKALEAYIEGNETDGYYFTGKVRGPLNGSAYTESEISKHFNTYEEAMAYIESLKNEGYSIDENSINFVNDTHTESGSINETYSTLEEAEKALEDFKSQWDEAEGNVETTNTNTIIDSTEGTTSYETEELATAALNLFIEENESDDYYFTGTVTGPKGNGTFTEGTINKTFATASEAEAYVRELENAGYTVTNISFANDTHTESGSINETYNTLEEAEKALEDFKSQWDEAEGNVEEIAGTNTTEDKIKSNLFDTEEEATTELNKLLEKNHDYEVIGEVKTEEVKSTVDETYEEHKFDSRLDAENEIARLESLGYDTSDMSIELATITESVIVNEDGVVIGFGEQDQQSFSYSHFDIKIPTSYTLIENENETTVNGTLSVSSVTIKNDSKTTTVRMTGPSNDETGKYKEYASSRSTRLSVTNKSYVNITGSVTYKVGNESITLPYSVEGYLSEAENECGGRGSSKGYDLLFSSIKIINQKVYIDTNIINIYKVSGTLHKEVSTDKYYFETQKTNFEYDYTVTGNGSKTVTDESGTLTADTSIENEGYFFDVEKKAKSHKVTGNGSKTVTDKSGTLTANKNVFYFDVEKKGKTYTVDAEGSRIVTLESGVLTADTSIDVYEEMFALDVTRQLFEYGGGQGGDIPITGAESTKAPQIILSIATLLLVVMLKKRIK